MPQLASEYLGIMLLCAVPVFIVWWILRRTELPEGDSRARPVASPLAGFSRLRFSPTGSDAVQGPFGAQPALAIFEHHRKIILERPSVRGAVGCANGHHPCRDGSAAATERCCHPSACGRPRAREAGPFA
jgi:hypothetical protein